MMRTGVALPPVAEAVENACIADGKRGQRQLEEGRFADAAEVFRGALARLGPVPTFTRAVLLERLGRSIHLSGRPDLATVPLQEGVELAGALDPTEGVRAIRGTLRSELGDAFRAIGRYDDARKSYEAALRTAEELNDPRRRGVDLSRLGALAQAEGNQGEAVARYEAALDCFRQAGVPALEAAARHQLGSVLHAQGRCAEAEQQYREAARINEALGDLRAAAGSWEQLALLLRGQPGRAAEVRRHAQAALAVLQACDPTSERVWAVYGVIADALEADLAAAGEATAAPYPRAQTYRELARHAPPIRRALDRLGPTAAYARAVLLARLGRSLRLGRRPDLALGQLREAARILRGLPAAPGALWTLVHLESGGALHASGDLAGARDQYEVALTAARSSGDLRAQAAALAHLGDLGRAAGQMETAAEHDRAARRLLADCDEPGTVDAAPDVVPAPPVREIEVRVYEDATTQHVFEPDLLLDDPPERHVTLWSTPLVPLAGELRPMLAPGARTWIAHDGTVRFGLTWSEPTFERQPDCTIMRRTRREVAVAGDSHGLWRLLRRMDGTRSVAELRDEAIPGERAECERLLAALAGTGVIDVSGRPIGRFLHTATKKGVLAAGGIVGDAVLQLATDGDYLEHAGAPRIPVSGSVPVRLKALHTLTRARRSRRDYGGAPLRKEELDALLQTACGVTGAMPWAGRDLRLRAYPSSGALYAVEVYPVVLRAKGMAPAVYHYLAADQALEVVRPLDGPGLFVAAALPVERAMLSGAAALICLTGRFRRHERKYGEGGYRMLVAEAGHVSQNLILAATALGLSARPFGGVFDALINDDLGLDPEEEQFLLAVVVGRAGGQQGRPS